MQTRAARATRVLFLLAMIALYPVEIAGGGNAYVTLVYGNDYVLAVRVMYNSLKVRVYLTAFPVLRTRPLGLGGWTSFAADTANKDAIPVNMSHRSRRR
jgi:hypothetical protein